jgi:hypothetical protein
MSRFDKRCDPAAHMPKEEIKIAMLPAVRIVVAPAARYIKGNTVLCSTSKNFYLGLPGPRTSVADFRRLNHNALILGRGGFPVPSMTRT